MRCEAIRESLPDHRLGTLPAEQASAVQAHLRGCGSCRAEAAALDQGIALFATATHLAEPPEELRDRVMAVLADEWSEDTQPGASSPRRRFSFSRFALAAAVVALAGTLVWGALAQAAANGRREDAVAYRAILQTLGGRDMRTAPLGASDTTTTAFDGSVILYDSHRGLSWVGVFVRMPQPPGPIHVAISAPGGARKEFPFSIEVLPEGHGVTWFDTLDDLSSYTVITLTAPDGTTLATATLPPSDAG